MATDHHGEWSNLYLLAEVAANEYDCGKKRKCSPVLQWEETPFIFKRPRTKSIMKITMKITMDSHPIVWGKTPFFQSPMTKKGASCCSNPVLKTKKGASCSNPHPKKPKMKKMTPGASSSSNPGPQMPQHLRNELVRMGATEVTYLMQKKLFKTDISDGHNRLSIPTSQVDGTNFLREGEKNSVQEVVVVDPRGVPWTLNFTQWNMKSSSIYVLIKLWKNLVKANDLCLNDMIHLWSFRCDSKLCFVLDVVRDDADKGVLPISDIATTSHGQEEED